MPEPAITRRGLLAAGAGAAVATALSGCHIPVISPGVDRSNKRKLIGLSLYADDPYTRSVASGVASALKGSGYALLARRAVTRLFVRPAGHLTRSFPLTKRFTEPYS